MKIRLLDKLNEKRLWFIQKAMEVKLLRWCRDIVSTTCRCQRVQTVTHALINSCDIAIDGVKGKITCLQSWTNKQVGCLFSGLLLLIVIIGWMFTSRGVCDSTEIGDDLWRDQYDTIEGMADAVVRADIADHYGSYFYPMRLNSYKMKEIDNDKALCNISFSVEFYPSASQYYVNFDQRFTFKEPISTYLSWSFDALKYNENSIVERKDIEELNLLAQRISEKLPEMHVFRPLTEDEMDDERFKMNRAYSVFYKKTKKGGFKLLTESRHKYYNDGWDPNPNSLGSNDGVGMTADFINSLRCENGAKPLLILATKDGEYDILKGKWREKYDSYMEIKRTLMSFSRINDLLGDMDVETLRSAYSGTLKQEVETALSVLRRTVIPERKEL